MPGHGDSLARDFRAAVDRAQLVDRTHGGDVERWAQSAGIQPSEILDFSASINPLGPPTTARKAFIESYGAISRYPDPYGDHLKRALARRHGMDPAEILIGNGSTQLIYLLCAALRPHTALVVGPAFSEYRNALALAGARIRTLFLAADNGFQFSMKDFLTAWEADCDIAFLTTPNSVTGQLIPKTQIENIADFAFTRKCPVALTKRSSILSRTNLSRKKCGAIRISSSCARSPSTMAYRVFASVICSPTRAESNSLPLIRSLGRSTVPR
jgi:hypothetical protein